MTKRRLIETGGGLRLYFAMDHGPKPDPLPVGTRLGAFELRDVLGGGGSAMVYRAVRCDGTFDQVVALKVLSTRDAAGQILRERDVLGGLKHPGIAQIIDGGSTPDGNPWFAMELVDGLPLDEHLDSVNAPLIQRLAAFRQVCAAVAYAHNEGIVHGDIKPNNILVECEGQIKLVDFGIARCMDATRSLRAEEDGAFSPLWASPEQARGEQLTFASDIYQLGLLLQELLTSAPQEASWPARALQRARERQVDAVVARATASNPAERYAGVAELAAEVDCLLSARPPIAARAELGSRLVLAAHRSRRLAALLAAFAVAMVVLLSRQSEELSATRAQFTQARDEDSLLAAFMSNTYAAAFTEMRGGKLLTNEQVLQSGITRLEALRDTPAWELRAIAEHLAYELVAVGRADLAVGVLTSQAERLDRDFADRLEERARIALTLGRALRASKADAAIYEPVIRRGLALLEQPGVQQTLQTQAAVAQAQIALAADENELRSIIESTLSLLQRNGERRSSEFVRFQLEHAKLLARAGELQPALAVVREACAQLREFKATSLVAMRKCLGLQSTVGGLLGAQEDIRGDLERIRDEARRLFGSDSVQYAEAEFELASAIFTVAADASEVGQVVDATRHSLEILQRATSYPGLQAKLLTYAEYLLLVDGAQEGLRVVAKAQALQPFDAADFPWSGAHGFAILGAVRCATGNSREADDAFRSAFEMIEKKPPDTPTHYMYGTIALYAAECWVATQRLEEARAILTKHLDWKEALNETSAFRRARLVSLGRTLGFDVR